MGLSSANPTQQKSPFFPQLQGPFDVQSSLDRIRRSSQQARQLQANTQQTADGLMAAGRDYADQQDDNQDLGMMAGVAADIDSMWDGMVSEANNAPVPNPVPRPGQEADDRMMAGVSGDIAGIQMPQDPAPEFKLDMGPAYDQGAIDALGRNAQTQMTAAGIRAFGHEASGQKGNTLPPEKAPEVPRGFSENSEAPLPGEETLPPAVAAWNDRRAKAGIRNGLQTLEQVYDAEREADPLLSKYGKTPVTFAEWVRLKGILPDMPVEEANARLDAIVGESLQASPDSMGGWKDNRQKHQELVDKRAQQQQQQLDMRGRKWVDDTSKRFAGQVGAQSVEAAYQAGLQEAIAKGSKNPHLDAVRFANSNLVNALRTGRAQQRQVNVKRQADQYNRARRMGIPQQVVIGLDGLADAATPDEKFRALAVLHTQAPMMGFDKMAAMIAKGQIDHQAMTAWAQQMGGKPSFDSDFARWNNRPLDETSYAGLMNLAHQTAGANATPQQVQEEARRLGVGRATQAVTAMMAGNGDISPGEASFVRQVVGEQDFDQFAQMFGLDTRNPKARAVYEKVTGRAVGFRLFDDALPSIGGAVAGAANAVAGFMADPMAPFRPKPPAQAQASGKDPDPFS